MATVQIKRATNTTIGVVTVTYNSVTVIDDFLNSILSQTYEDFLLYIVDNASSDTTLAAVAARHDPRIIVIANDANLGVAEGNNQGIIAAKEAGCAHVLLINNDTLFSLNLVNVMMESMSERKADMLVPKMMYFEPKTMIWCAGGFFRPWLGYPTGHFGEGETDHGQYQEARRIKYAPTCCMLIAMRVFDSLGLMDPTYFVYFDDTDFCWRANRANISHWYEPKGVLYHKVSSLTGGTESDFSIRYTTRNKVYFVLKNLPLPKVIYCMAIYHLIFMYKFLSRRDSWRIYRLKVISFFQGLQLYFRNRPS